MKRIYWMVITFVGTILVSNPVMADVVGYIFEKDESPVWLNVLALFSTLIFIISIISLVKLMFLKKSMLDEEKNK